MRNESLSIPNAGSHALRFSNSHVLRVATQVRFRNLLVPEKEHETRVKHISVFGAKTRLFCNAPLTALHWHMGVCLKPTKYFLAKENRAPIRQRFYRLTTLPGFKFKSGVNLAVNDRKSLPSKREENCVANTKYPATAYLQNEFPTQRHATSRDMTFSRDFQGAPAKSSALYCSASRARYCA